MDTTIMGRTVVAIRSPRKLAPLTPWFVYEGRERNGSDETKPFYVYKMVPLGPSVQAALGALSIVAPDLEIVEQ